MRETADVIIIGGGVIGTSIAYHLAKKQVGRIILLERDFLASGSTGHSVASIDFVTLQKHAVELYARSANFFQNCANILGEDCGFVETGSIILGGPQHEDQLFSAVKNMRSANLNLRLLTLNELQELDPRMALEGVTTASYTPHAGHLDPVMITNAFAKSAKKLGVDICQGHEATSLLTTGNQVTGVDVSNGQITSPLVIIAAGPWSIRFLGSIGIDLSLHAVSHPVVSICRPADFGGEHKAILDLTTGIYARPESGGLTLLGSLDPNVGHDPVDPLKGPKLAHDDYILWTMERLIQRYPLLSTSELRKGWAGLMTISPDWQPVIGEIPDWQGLFCAIGFSGLGLQISPAVGELLSGLITGDKSAAQQLAPFSPARFSSDQLMQTYRNHI